MNTVEILKAGRALLAAPNGWCKNIGARDASGNSCNSFDPEAVSFCMEGAIVHAAGNVPDAGLASEALNKIVMKMIGGTYRSFAYVQYNDDANNVAEVLAVYDAAIAEVEGTSI